MIEANRFANSLRARVALIYGTADRGTAEPAEPRERLTLAIVLTKSVPAFFAD